MYSHNPIILGPNNSNFPKLGFILARFLVSDLSVSEGLEARMIAALKAIQAVIPSAPWMESVPAERHHILTTKLGL
jgi:hypothetical protein